MSCSAPDVLRSVARLVLGESRMSCTVQSVARLWRMALHGIAWHRVMEPLRRAKWFARHRLGPRELDMQYRAAVYYLQTSLNTATSTIDESMYSRTGKH